MGKLEAVTRIALNRSKPRWMNMSAAMQGRLDEADSQAAAARDELSKFQQATEDHRKEIEELKKSISDG